MLESDANELLPQGARFYPKRPTMGGSALALHLQTNTNQKLFTGHGADYIAINGQRFQQPMVVTADGVRSDWAPTDFDSLTSADFDYFLQMKPEVLLLGTGAKQRFARPELFSGLIRAGISIEFMDTPAACRTYNILVAEDRKVVAAVLL
ncbi:MAG: hypothetical protein FD121_122 [Gallionellaceae bacterium]|nr:MAG: hypothetical protein FD121_122 [Gallionellaceae bacterium]